MALVQLSDTVVPAVYRRYMTSDTMERSNIFQSGILSNNGELASFLAGGGLTVNLPFWKDLADNEPGIANDDSSSTITPDKIGTGTQVAIRNVRTKAWSSADLVNELTGEDPMARIRERVGAYWSRAFERQLISILIGVFADNAANDSGDMRLVKGTDVSGSPTDDQYISAENILDGAQTMGDASDSLGLIIMHSVCYNRLAKNNLIDFIPDSEGRVRFPTYLGYRVVKDDTCRVVQGTTNTARFLYSTYLVGNGAIAFAESSVATPVEVYREPLKGNGMGIETLITRRQFAFHPLGFKWTDSSRAGNFPTNSEYQTTANWDRVVSERKMVPLVELVTNG